MDIYMMELNYEEEKTLPVVLSDLLALDHAGIDLEDQLAGEFGRNGRGLRDARDLEDESPVEAGVGRADRRVQRGAFGVACWLIEAPGTIRALNVEGLDHADGAVRRRPVRDPRSAG